MPTASPLSAKQVHASLVRAVAEVETAEKNLVFWFGEMLEHELYRDLGFSSIYQYAAVKLSFSRSKTAQLIQVCRSLRELPRLREAVGSGEVPWTKARTVVPVATPRTETRWVEEAKQSSRQTLQRKVTATRKASRKATSVDAELPFHEPIEETAPREAPVDVTLRFSPAEYARYEALIAALGPDPTPAKILEALSVLAEARASGGEQRSQASRAKAGGLLGHGIPGAGGEGRDRVSGEDRESPADAGRGSDVAGADRKATVGSSAETFASGGADPGSTTSSSGGKRRAGEPPYQVVVRRCPDCGAGAIPTTRGDLPVDPATLRQVACDSRGEKNGRNTAVIPPSVRRKVLERDGHRCRSAGCGRTRHLEVHHRVLRSRGGSNRPDNLITLCSGCHRATHRHAGERERAPGCTSGTAAARA